MRGNGPVRIFASVVEGGATKWEGRLVVRDEAVAYRRGATLDSVLDQLEEEKDIRGLGK